MRNLFVLTLAAFLSACGNEPVINEIKDGSMQGYVEEGVEHYLGIPYAQSPEGELRWRAPRPVQGWEGVLAVQETPSPCPQFIPMSGSMQGSEDCLYLNVWTPAEKPAEPMPVMVWIHGGGFTAGQGAYTASEGAGLAGMQDVVVVSMNYRLGVFGFLAHEALGSEDAGHPGSGNYGIEDQTEALRWVQKNISRFGGDPDNVTIFGQSAGGVSVCTQLASPQAAGLFHRAVIMSGPCETPISPLAGAVVLGEKLEQGLECAAADDVLRCMRGKPVEEVVAVLPPDPAFAFGEGYTVWWPVQDGNVLPLQMMEAFDTGQFNQVPIINGATRDEAAMLIWISHDMQFKPLKNEQYPVRLKFLMGSDELSGKVEARYSLEKYGSAFDALTASFSDGFFNCFARHQSAALAQHVPTWSYQFDYAEAPFFIPFVELGAYHGGEIQYLMGSPASFISGSFDQEGERLSQSMMGYWAQFARHGNPNGEGLMNWPAYDGRDQTLILDRKNRMEQGVHKDDCQFWESLPYLRAPNPAPI